MNIFYVYVYARVNIAALEIRKLGWNHQVVTTRLRHRRNKRDLIRQDLVVTTLLRHRRRIRDLIRRDLAVTQ